ncbi:MAG: DUF1573 domain-containing protein [Chlorobi bacterium]|nr:DUF1573 domain-containing protein [Chlorobiota bacterium]
MKLIRKITISGSIFITLLNTVSCNEKKSTDNKTPSYKGKPKIEFYETTHDLGTLTEGETAEYIFEYKNTGTAPLIIKNITTDCGCTTPEYTKKETLPGEKNKIKIIFDSEGFRNNIYKTITIKTNADTNNIKLILTAYIKNDNNLNY